MKVNFEFTWTFLAMSLLAVGVIVAILLAMDIGESGIEAEQLLSDNPGHELSLSDADFNKLIGLVWAGGVCERLGLMQSAMWQQDEQGNRYAIPICVNQQ